MFSDVNVEDILNGKVYIKTITDRSISCETTGTSIRTFTVPNGYRAIIDEIAASNDAVEIDFLVEGASLGAKYGLPVKAEALPTNRTGIPLGLVVEGGKEVEIVGRGIGATTTLTALRVTVIFKKSE